MATPTQNTDRASLETRVCDVVRELLKELGNRQAAQSVRGSARLDHDLGLGSLERVELLLRLEREFGTRLPETTMAEANTLDEVIVALGETLGASTTAPAGGPHTLPREQLRSMRTDFSPVSSGATASPATGAAGDTWQEVLRHRAQVSATRPNVILWEDDAESHRLSFGELYEGAQTVAASLAQRGIVRGDAVALMLPTCREFFLMFTGILMAGAVPVPIYPPVRADRIAEYAERQSAILRNAEARLLITFREAERVAKLLRPQVRSLRGIATAAALLEVAPAPAAKRATPIAATYRASADDLALLQYTSGSTGDPKGVMLTHANLLANVRAAGEALDMRDDDVGVSWLPLYHDMGLIGAWLTLLYFGRPVVVLSPIAFLTRPERWLWALDKYRGTMTAAPNFAYELAVRKITDSDIEGLDLSSVRAALNGAEPVNADTLDRFVDRFGRHGFRREALTPVYGLAEGSLAVTVPPMGRGPRVDRIAREGFTREGRAVPVAAPAGAADISALGISATGIGDAGVLSFVSVGSAVPKHEVRIVDDRGHEAAERTEGKLWFRGPSTTQGYFRNSAASAALFPEGGANGWLDSGDRGYQADGEIFITGRVKDIILKAGRNLYPHEIEEVAARVAGVRKGCVAAFGAPDAASGTERLVVVAETRERGTTERAGIAAAIVQEVSAAIGVPPDVVELLHPHGIPKTSSGKLRRSEARQSYLDGTLHSAVPPPWLQVARLALSSGVRTAARVAGHGLRRALELLYGVYAASVFAIWLPLAWLLVKFAPSRSAAAAITSRSLRILLALVGCRVRVEDREYFSPLETKPDVSAPRARMLVSNHTSYFDVLVLMAALGVDYHFVAKQEVHSMPFIGTFLRKLGHFAFDRSNPQARLRQADRVLQALRQGESVFIFPEGTFTAQDGIRPFQLGAFKAAVYAGCPVIPIALRGTRQFLRDGQYLPRPTTVTVTICPPLEPKVVPAGAEWQEIVRLRDAARAAIGEHAGEPLL